MSVGESAQWVVKCFRRGDYLHSFRCDEDYGHFIPHNEEDNGRITISLSLLCSPYAENSSVGGHSQVGHPMKLRVLSYESKFGKA